MSNNSVLIFWFPFAFKSIVTLFSVGLGKIITSFSFSISRTLVDWAADKVPELSMVIAQVVPSGEVNIRALFGPLDFIFPTTSSFSEGDAVPIPTSPALLIVNGYVWYESETLLF